jgi:hypothetical protein
MSPERPASGPEEPSSPAATATWHAARPWPDNGDRAAGGPPTVALLAPTWESSTEEGWMTRQVAGALATVADVHVVTPQGIAPADRIDSVFAVHELGTPISPTAQLRRDLLIEAVSAASGPGRPVPPSMVPLLDRGVVDPWDGAGPVLERLRPDLVVVAGHQHVGALEAVDGSVPGTPVALLALGTDLDSLGFPHFDRLIDRARAVLAVTEAERQAVIAAHGRPDDVHRIGAPMAANPSALSEPNPWVGTHDYVLVITDADSEAEEEVVELARLIRLSFPENPIGISYRDVFVVWHEGRWVPGWPVERSSDLARLMAWARVTVDLRPGTLFARRCVDSLLFGTPIIVPAGSRAREHAQRGRGGLWFSTPAELMWCIEALLDPDTRAPLSRQGRAYAEEEYGSTDRFVDRVAEAVGLTTPMAGARPGDRKG